MRPIVTVTAVVLLHLCVIAVLVGVNGCRSTTGLETDGEPVAYAAGGRVAGPAPVAAPVAGLPVATAAPAPVLTSGRLATPAPTKVTPIAAVGAGGVHVVVKGENLTTIASREKVSVNALASANGLPLNATLQTGQKLKIPAPGAASAKPAPAKPAATTTRATSAAPAIEFAPLRLSTSPAPAEAAPTPAAPAAPAAPAKK
jgi:pyruvate dehydrogenase E2 component (dihydrolipoamide acetyltransferase)